MTHIAVMLYPDRIGIARVGAVGKKPSYAPPMWLGDIDVLKLVSEPSRLAELIRNEIGGDETVSVYLRIWPALCNNVLFSHAKHKAKEIDRLRFSELETVFHGHHDEQYVTDYPIDNGKYSFAGKSRHILFTVPRRTVDAMRQAFEVKKLKLSAVVPMSISFVESAVRFCEMAEGTTALVLFDDACTSIALVQNKSVRLLRTVAPGAQSLLETFCDITGLTAAQCRRIICASESSELDRILDKAPMLKDAIYGTCNRLCSELEKAAKSLDADNPKIDRVIIGGSLVGNEKLAAYIGASLATECITVEKAVSQKNASELCIREEDITAVFTLGAVTFSSCDLLSEWRKKQNDKKQQIVMSAALVAVAAVLMAITPFQLNQLKKEKQAAEDILNRAEYLSILELIDDRSDANRDKTALAKAIENLPYNTSKVISMIEEVTEITGRFGRLSEMSVSRTNNKISFTFTTESFDTYLEWQTELEKSGRFSFVSVPTFTSAGSSYVVRAEVTSPDFELKEAK